ncbi:hypothetical protein O181_068014 [Austropuccinia psidii MF-1]|uniref:Uncharacterized protein n=1 Tax=Austropuccinia psidii MF-1 TaxID=1389203 RepID=A0A9Q3EW37_9BASI|nr:hypothetical protein [Austropuccinia psidii MF-1]
MIPPHLRDLSLSRDNHMQSKLTIRSNRDLKWKEFEVYQSHRIWKTASPSTFQDSFQLRTSRRGLHRIRKINSYPSNSKRTSSMGNGRQGIPPRVPLENICRKCSKDFPHGDILQIAHGNHQRVKFQQEVQNSERNGNQYSRQLSYHMCYREARNQREHTLTATGPQGVDRQRITGKEITNFEPEAESVTPYDPEMFGPGERSKKKQKIAVASSDEARSPKTSNYISTQSEHNVVTPESTIRSTALWMQMAQFSEQTQKRLESLHEKTSRLHEVDTLQTKSIHTL